MNKPSTGDRYLKILLILTPEWFELRKIFAKMHQMKDIFLS